MELREIHLLTKAGAFVLLRTKPCLRLFSFSPTVVFFLRWTSQPRPLTRLGAGAAAVYQRKEETKQEKKKKVLAACKSWHEVGGKWLRWTPTSPELPNAGTVRGSARFASMLSVAWIRSSIRSSRSANYTAHAPPDYGRLIAVVPLNAVINTSAACVKKPRRPDRWARALYKAMLINNLITKGAGFNAFRAERRHDSQDPGAWSRKITWCE